VHKPETLMLESKPMTADHVERLRESYQAVGDVTWGTDDFLETNLATSRSLFTPESLLARRPQTRELEVYALVAGLPFQEQFIRSLVRAQESLSAVLDSVLHYWVAPANLGVEYAVFKWPTDPWNEAWLESIKCVLGAIRKPAFAFEIGGVQINPDGCVVAKGFDEGGVLFRIREQLKTALPFLPAKQSGWAHVPLGRILEPVGASRFRALGQLVRELSRSQIAITKVESMKLVHETRWYMEEKTILADYPLSGFRSR
jgi:hypothetical protein